MTDIDELFSRDVQHAHRFRVHHGPDLQNIRALLAYLPDMTDAQFAHHVTREKNDFAQWIEDVHGAGDVSRAIRSTRSREDLRRVLQGMLEEFTAGKTAQEAKREATPPPIEVEVIERQAPATANMNDDAAFGKLRDEYGERNEGLQEKYDEIARRMKEALDDPFPDDLVRLEEAIKAEYEELRARASALRKRGLDAFIASLILRQFQGKLALAHATRDKKEYEQVRIILQQARFELDETERAPVGDVKTEVLARAGIEQGNIKDGRGERA